MATSSWIVARRGESKVQSLGHSRSLSVDVGEIALRRSGVVVYQVSPHIPESFQKAVKASQKFGRLLQELEADKTMQDFGTACPQLCLIPRNMYPFLQRLIREGMVFTPNDVVVFWDYDFEFRAILNELRNLFQPFPHCSVSQDPRDPFCDHTSQRSAGSSSVESAQWLRLQLQSVESNEEVSDQDMENLDWSGSDVNRLGSNL